MIRFQHHLEIDRSPEDVFEALTDLDRMPEWQSNVLAVSKQTAGPVQAGTTVTQTVRMMGRRQGILRVAAFTPSELVAYAGDLGLADYYGAFELTRLRGGTALAARTEFRLHGWWRPLRPILGSAIRRESGRELATLKRLIEADAHGMHAAPAR